MRRGGCRGMRPLSGRRPAPQQLPSRWTRTGDTRRGRRRTLFNVSTTCVVALYAIACCVALAERLCAPRPLRAGRSPALPLSKWSVRDILLLKRTVRAHASADHRFERPWADRPTRRAHRPVEWICHVSVRFDSNTPREPPHTLLTAFELCALRAVRRRRGARERARVRRRHRAQLRRRRDLPARHGGDGPGDRS